MKTSLKVGSSCVLLDVLHSEATPAEAHVLQVPDAKVASCPPARKLRSLPAARVALRQGLPVQGAEAPGRGSPAFLSRPLPRDATALGWTGRTGRLTGSDSSPSWGLRRSLTVQWGSSWREFSGEDTAGFPEQWGRETPHRERQSRTGDNSGARRGAGCAPGTRSRPRPAEGPVGAPGGCRANRPALSGSAFHAASPHAQQVIYNTQCHVSTSWIMMPCPKHGSISDSLPPPPPPHVDEYELPPALASCE
ncbi:hypothetical protein CB1_000372016 [Camelus ferus]|nr:hypothetical protein CB1_000372016 [Camelus ferus]